MDDTVQIQFFGTVSNEQYLEQFHLESCNIEKKTAASDFCCFELVIQFVR